MRLSSDGKTLIKVDSNEIKGGTFKIPDDVTTIGENAFSRAMVVPGIVIFPKECKKLKQIVIPNGVISIEGYAFECCVALQAISLPESVKVIHEWAFRRCEPQIIFINSSDNSERDRITHLLPVKLQNKVSPVNLHAIWDEQLERILKSAETNQLYRNFNTNTEKNKWLPNEIFVVINNHQGSVNPYYHKARALMSGVPLPTSEKGIPAYKKKIKTIADNCIKKAVEFNNKPDYSFLLNVLTAIAAVSAVALIVAALVTPLVIVSHLSIPLLAGGLACGAAAAGIFFYRASTMPKDEQKNVATPEQSFVPG